MMQFNDLVVVNSTGGTTPRRRRIWLAVHRWLGLTVGMVFVLIGLTGSLLVFDHAIDEWLNPRLLLTDGAGERASVTEVIESAERTCEGAALSVSRPRVRNGVWTVWFSSGTEAEPKFTAVHVDPFGAQVTGKRVWGEDLMSWIYRLHFRLLSGATGATLVGIIGIIMMVSILSGVYLWWPLWRHSWRSALAIRRGRRFNYDLHKTTGIASAFLLLVIAFTGVYMEFPHWFQSTVKVFADVTDPPDDLASEALEGAKPLTPDQALAIAQKQFPDARFDHLHPPTGTDGFYEVAFRQHGEVQMSFGRSQVFLDQYTGKTLAIRRPQEFTAADAFFAWQFPLHSGEAFGLAGRWLVFVTGLAPGVLYVTGFLLWLRRRRFRNRRLRDSTPHRKPNESRGAALATLEAAP